MTYSIEEAYILYYKSIEEDEREQGNMKHTILSPLTYLQNKEDIKKKWLQSFKEMEQLHFNLDNDFVKYMNYLCNL